MRSRSHEGGAEYLFPNGAPGATQGSTITVEVTREAIPGSEPWKRPLAKVSSAEGSLADPLKGRELIFPAPTDHFGDAGWNDLLDEGRSGVVRFAGGELRIAATPAMTLIDVDGFLDAGKLSVIGAVEAARAIRRLDIGGSIGIDLPPSRERRQGSPSPPRSTIILLNRSSVRPSTALVLCRSFGRGGVRHSSSSRRTAPASKPERC